VSTEKRADVGKLLGRETYSFTAPRRKKSSFATKILHSRGQLDCSVVIFVCRHYDGRKGEGKTRTYLATYPTDVFLLKTSKEEEA